MEENYKMDAEHVRLNIDALIRVAANACGNAHSQMVRYQAEIDNARFSNESEYHKNHHRQFYGKLLAEASQQYTDALESYFALVEAKRRENVTLIRD